MWLIRLEVLQIRNLWRKINCNLGNGNILMADIYLAS